MIGLVATSSRLLAFAVAAVPAAAQDDGHHRLHRRSTPR